MAKSRQTFWDFGAPAQPDSPKPAKVTEEKPFTIREITGKIRQTLESGFGSVSVVGEISNLRIQSSGHAYFVLKDEASQLQCVLFKRTSSEARMVLSDGIKAIAKGEITVYEPRGQYQLVVRSLVPAGQGELQLAFERLKRKLHAEGLFDPTRKRPIPRYPETIGLVTSPTGAAIRDVLHVLERRHPNLRIVLAPCRVQGDGAAAEIAKALQLLNAWNAKSGKMDAILITRGGGSLEDLWAFNEEVVARAIHASEVPVISAIGHEIDFTISDFVADLRAATPSAAAEILSEGAVMAKETLNEWLRRLKNSVLDTLDQATSETEDLRKRLLRAHPRRQLESISQRMDELCPRLRRSVQLHLKDRNQEFSGLGARLLRASPAGHISELQEHLDRQQRAIREKLEWRLEDRQKVLSALSGKLELLAPFQVLKRGYSITLRSQGQRILRSADEVQAGEDLITVLHDGRVSSVVREASGPR